MHSNRDIPVKKNKSLKSHFQIYSSILKEMIMHFHIIRKASYSGRTSLKYTYVSILE